MTTTTETAQPTVEPDREPHDPPDAGRDGAEEKLVPVGESIRYRRRAQQAEHKLTELQQMLERSQAELGEARRSLEEAERRRGIDQLLVEADAIDLEAARLLTEAAVAQMDDADVAEVVDDLRRHKPYLFRRTDSVGAMSPRPRRDDGGPADEAAAMALASGNRRDLLRYLRLRRGA